MRNNWKLVNLYIKVVKEVFINIKKYSLLILVFSTMLAFQSYIFLRFIEYITNIVVELTKSNNTLNIYTELKVVAIYILIIIGLKILAGIYSIIKIDYTNNVNKYLNKNIKTKLSSIWFEDFESVEIYRKINRVTNKVFDGYNAIVESLIRIAEIILYLVFYIVLLSKINMIFSFLVCFSLMISGLLATKRSKLQYQAFVDITPINQKRDYLCDLGNRKNIHHEYQANRLFSYIFDKYKDTYWEAAKAYLKIHRYTIFSEGKAFLLFSLVSLAAYVYVVYGVMQGLQEISTLTMMVFLFDNMYQKSSSLSYYIANRTNDMLSVDEYYELLDRDEEIKVEKVEKISKPPTIEFRDVSYKYPQSNNYALKGLSLKINSGEKIAIVGDNGSGKTTFTNILMGFVPDYEGEVLIDGIPLPENFTKLRNSIRCMTQDLCKYQFAIKENISMGDLNRLLDDEEIIDIMTRIGLDQFIEELPNKLDTKLGQLDKGGIELSQGQWQKLSAGRLLANKNAKVWIFDEPTAYLDPLAEIEMYDFLYDLSKNRTTIFISHRLGFVKKADRILVFDDGKIIEKGTHRELMDDNGKYWKMYQTQKDWYM